MSLEGLAVMLCEGARLRVIPHPLSPPAWNKIFEMTIRLRLGFQ